ncbi:hypothetical protein F4810DRAFT_665677 [Camillea tinctor]|nr:hypothetical protein F4810DRAFT_665677 [Camillea tinctor]
MSMDQTTSYTTAQRREVIKIGPRASLTTTVKLQIPKSINLRPPSPFPGPSVVSSTGPIHPQPRLPSRYTTRHTSPTNLVSQNPKQPLTDVQPTTPVQQRQGQRQSSRHQRRRATPRAASLASALPLRKTQSPRRGRGRGRRRRRRLVRLRRGVRALDGIRRRHGRHALRQPADVHADPGGARRQRGYRGQRAAVLAAGREARGSERGRWEGWEWAWGRAWGWERGGGLGGGLKGEGRRGWRGRFCSVYK